MKVLQEQGSMSKADKEQKIIFKGIPDNMNPKINQRNRHQTQ